MAKLATVVDSLDAVPETLRELYVEDNGKFRLDADIEDVSGLKSALEKEKRAAKEAKDALKRYDGLDPEEYQRLKAAADEAEQTKLQTEGKWEEMKQRLSDSHKKETEKLSGEVTKRDRFIERLLVDNELNSALVAAGVRPEMLPAVRAMMKEKGPKVVAEGDDYRGMLGEVSITEYVKSWAGSDDALPFLQASGSGGSGAGGNGGSGGGAASTKKVKDMSEREKVEFIAKHGLTEWQKKLAAERA